MTEAYHPHDESKKEKDDEEDKKVHKKHAAKAHLGKTAAHKHVSHEHRHKLDDDAPRPSAVETPKRIVPEAAPKDLDTPVPPAEEAAWPDEFKKLHDEIVASVPKEDDEESEKPKKHVAEHEDEDIEAKAPKEEQAPEPEVVVGAAEHIEPELPENVQSKALAELTALGIPEQIISSEEAASNQGEPMAVLPAVELPGETDTQPPDHEVPLATTIHEEEPITVVGEMPVDDTEPLIPQTELEQFGYGESDAEPWGQPAGGLANPNVLEKIDKIDKRERLNDAYHGSREAGLGAAVGLIGLGLILEHFAAKRRDKKLKRQLDAQSRQLKKTNQAVQLERQSSQTSSRKLEQIEAVQAAKSEHARAITSAVQSAEVATAVAVAANELSKTNISNVQEKVLAERLSQSKELGQAIKRNPELSDMNDSQELVRSLEIAEETAAKQEHQIDGKQREVSYEKLQGKYADNKGPTKSGGGASVDPHGMPALPTPQQQLPAGVQADLMLDEHALISKSGKTSSNAIVPVAAVTVLLILAALIVVVFAKL
jgi:hypothetical protein